MWAAVPCTETTRAPSARGRSSGVGCGVSVEVGKSRVMLPSASAVAASTPQRAANRTVPVALPVSRSTCAVARVAWPHMSTSVAGVNQRSAQSASPPGGSGCANAVSAWLTSRATCCIQPSSGKSRSSTTPAGLPANGRSLKASTIQMRMHSTLTAPVLSRFRGHVRAAVPASVHSGSGMIAAGGSTVCRRDGSTGLL